MKVFETGGKTVRTGLALIALLLAGREHVGIDAPELDTVSRMGGADAEF